MNEYEILIYGLGFLLMLTFFFLFYILSKTPAAIFFKALRKKKPITIMVRKDGEGKLIIPDKIESGVAYFKKSGDEKGYFLSSIAFVPIGKYGRIGYILEDRAFYIPPRIAVAASELKRRGFSNYVEADLSLAILQLEKETGNKFNKGGQIEWEDEQGKRIKIDAIDAIKRELTERRYELLDEIPLANIDGEIESIIKNQTHHRIRPSTAWSIMDIKDFFRYEASPDRLTNIISLTKAVTRKEMQKGGFGGMDAKTIVAVGTVIFFVIVGWVVLSQTGVLDQTMSALTGAGNVAKQAVPPVVTTTIPGGIGVK